MENLWLLLDNFLDFNLEIVFEKYALGLFVVLWEMIRTKIVPHAVRNRVFDCEVCRCHRIHVPQLVIQLSRALQVVDKQRIDQTHENSHAGDDQAQMSLRGQIFIGLLAIVLNIHS